MVAVTQELFKRGLFQTPLGLMELALELYISTFLLFFLPSRLFFLASLLVRSRLGLTQRSP
jgi:hypothetical protein